MGEWLVKLLKNLAQIIVPVGAGAIIGGITTEATKNCDKVTKIAAGATAIILDGLVTKATLEYFDEAVDDLDNAITKNLPEGE